MDNLQIIEVLESFAGEVIKNESGESTEQVSRWQKLFGYSHDEAVERIKQHRADVNRLKLSDEQWRLV